MTFLEKLSLMLGGLANYSRERVSGSDCESARHVNPQGKFTPLPLRPVASVLGSIRIKSRVPNTKPRRAYEEGSHRLPQFSIFVLRRLTAAIFTMFQKPPKWNHSSVMEKTKAVSIKKRCVNCWLLLVTWSQWLTAYGRSSWTFPQIRHKVFHEHWTIGGIVTPIMHFAAPEKNH